MVEFWRHRGEGSRGVTFQNLSDQFDAVNATLVEPLRAWQHGDSGSYYLLMAHFKIQKS